ncbi:phosphoribosylformylglycinamidine synthase I [candidate division GN15 bacterium]|uniref:Phosphoribosylformylglycinamidine synthase subunit PurQ n=1 Tax=candidate division GN15 bacterium TaxID=2072418 RepID=A0A855XA64_9BACT|nr:MAG: phosphoribosylformylglycinamidine synthase I [candidate division GN15 bacterium]
MKFGVVTFPGSNGDYDSYAAVRFAMKEKVEFLWHKSEDLQGCDAVILPGGFAHGDYLRAGAIARFSPIMKHVIKFAKSGGIVIGFCNGFQVLTESGLLPGALLRNNHLRFNSKFIYIRVERTDTPFTGVCRKGEVLKIPIAHGEGNYYNFESDVRKLEDNGQVLFRYADASGNASAAANPNGSINNIAGIVSAEGNVLGMMPHPERAVEDIIGSSDGLKVFESVLNYCISPKPVGRL